MRIFKRNTQSIVQNTQTLPPWLEGEREREREWKTNICGKLANEFLRSLCNFEQQKKGEENNRKNVQTRTRTPNWPLQQQQQHQQTSRNVWDSRKLGREKPHHAVVKIVATTTTASELWWGEFFKPVFFFVVTLLLVLFGLCGGEAGYGKACEKLTGEIGKT